MLGPRIAALRREANLSQAELAQRLKISPSAVGMYEQGRREPSIELLVNMAQVFGVSTDFLLTGKTVEIDQEELLNQLVLSRLASVDQRLSQRGRRPFSREELMMLFAALLMEP